MGHRHKSHSHKEWAALGIYARHSMMTRNCETQSSSWGFVSSSTGLLKTRVCAGLCLPIEHCDYKILKYADSTARMFSVLWLLLGPNPQQQHCTVGCGWLDNALVMDPHELSWYRVCQFKQAQDSSQLLKILHHTHCESPFNFDSHINLLM